MADSSGRKKKEKISLEKKELEEPKLTLRIAKKRTTTNDGAVATAEIKEKKKRGRPRLLPGTPKPTRREKKPTGFSVWAELEMPILRGEHPELKRKGPIKDVLRAKWKELPKSQRRGWRILAKRERARLDMGNDTAASANASLNEGQAHSSPRAPMNAFGTSSPIEMNQQPHLMPPNQSPGLAVAAPLHSQTSTTITPEQPLLVDQQQWQGEYPSMTGIPKGVNTLKKESIRNAMVMDQQRLQDQHYVAYMLVDEPTMHHTMSYEELMYNLGSVASRREIMADKEMTEHITYGRIDGQAHHQEELDKEMTAAVSFLTGDRYRANVHRSKERATRKRRSDSRQKTVKRQKMWKHKPVAQVTLPKGELVFGQDDVYGEMVVLVSGSPAAYEVACEEPQPTEEESDVFFFGTPQDVQSLLEVRHQPEVMQRTCRWWLKDEDPELNGMKGNAPSQSPPRAFTSEPLDAAAVFKLIGQSFQTVGTQLMKIQKEESPHEIAAGMDVLLDSLMCSVAHLLSLTGAVPPFDQRYNSDPLAQLIEETSMMIPL